MGKNNVLELTPFEWSFDCKVWKLIVAGVDFGNLSQTVYLRLSKRYNDRNIEEIFGNFLTEVDIEKIKIEKDTIIVLKP